MMTAAKMTIPLTTPWLKGDTPINTIHVGVQDIAVLVGNPEIRVTAALAVSFLSRTSPKKRQVDYFDRIIDDLRNAAAKINDNLKIKGVL
jgi:hypothetical protein